MTKKANEVVYLTKDGLEELKNELEELKKVKRPQLVDRVAEARNHGDLSENSEYTNSKEELSMMDGRIDELEDIIARAKVASNKITNDKVKIGSQVTVKIKGKEHVFTVVGEWEADPNEKKISNDSPLGKALLGKRKGEKVKVEAPAGTIHYDILEIK